MARESEHDKKRADFKAGISKRMDSVKPLGTGHPGALFSRSGPVSLGSGNKGTMMLGDISSPRPPTPAPVAPDSSVPGAQQTSGQPYVPAPPVIGTDINTGDEQTGTMPSASTSWSPVSYKPQVDRASYIHPFGIVIGNVYVRRQVFIAAGAVVRGDNDEPIYIGEESNIQEGVVLRDLPSSRDGQAQAQRVVDVGSGKYSLYIGRRVSIAPQAQVHGPAYVADGVYIGMQSLVFWARIETGVVIEPGSLVMNVTIPSGVFVPAGLKVTSQKLVKDLPPLTSKYRFHGISDETVSYYLELLKGYRALS